jgi:hypothetical protein
MPTILLSAQGSTDSNDVWRACLRKPGWDSHRARRFSLPDPIPDVMCAYGKNYFCDAMAERAGLALLDPPDSWLSSLSPSFLLRNVVSCRAKDIPAFGERLFFKPANDKVFEAGVFERGSDVPLRFIDPECPCLVSEVVDFDVEVRLHVLDGAIVACQQYRLYSDRPEEDVHEDAKLFAQEVIGREYERLPSSVVLDVGHVEGRGWAVVEANPLYSSGVYAGTDAAGVLEAILRSSGPRRLLSGRDKPFLRNPDHLTPGPRRS